MLVNLKIIEIIIEKIMFVNKVVIELWSIVMLLWCFYNLVRIKGIDYIEWNMYYEYV